MFVVTDAIVEAFLGTFESDQHRSDASIGERARSALEAVLPMLMGEGAAVVDADKMLDLLPNDHYSVWIETATP